MATGRRAFEGTTAPTVIGAVLHTDPPPLSTLQPLAPPALDRLVARCLAKDPDDRWQTARDLTLELKWIAEHTAPPAQAFAGASPQRKFAWMGTSALAVVAAAAVAFVAASIGRSPNDSASTVSLTLTLPDELTLTGIQVGGPITISPDGQRLAFVATGPDGRQLVWVRPLNSLDAEPLAGTEGGALPFWSPDSQALGFFAQGRLKKIALAGGPPQTLCDALQPRGGAWSREDVIVFAAATGYEPRVIHHPSSLSGCGATQASGLRR